jgi:hypothetical protein
MAGFRELQEALQGINTPLANRPEGFHISLDNVNLWGRSGNTYGNVYANNLGRIGGNPLSDDHYAHKIIDAIHDIAKSEDGPTRFDTVITTPDGSRVTALDYALSVAGSVRNPAARAAILSELRDEANRFGATAADVDTRIAAIQAAAPDRTDTPRPTRSAPAAPQFNPTDDDAVVTIAADGTMTATGLGETEAGAPATPVEGLQSRINALLTAETVNIAGATTPLTPGDRGQRILQELSAPANAAEVPAILASLASNQNGLAIIAATSPEAVQSVFPGDDAASVAVREQFANLRAQIDGDRAAGQGASNGGGFEGFFRAIFGMFLQFTNPNITEAELDQQLDSMFPSTANAHTPAATVRPSPAEPALAGDPETGTDIVARITNGNPPSVTFNGIEQGTPEYTAAQALFNAMSDGAIAGNDQQVIEAVLREYPHLANMNAQLLPEGQVQTLVAFCGTAMQEGEFDKVASLFTAAQARVAASATPTPVAPQVFNKQNAELVALANSFAFNSADTSRSSLDTLFTAYDANGNGQLEAQEIQNLAKASVVGIAASAGKADDTALHAFMERAGVEFTNVPYTEETGFILTPSATPNVAAVGQGRGAA